MREEPSIVATSGWFRGSRGKKRKKEKIHCELKRFAGGVEDTVHKNAVKGLPNRWEVGVENNIAQVMERDKLRDQRNSTALVPSRGLSAGSSTSWMVGVELWLPRLSLADL